MAYRLWFWRPLADSPAPPAAVVAALHRADWSCVQSAPELQALRRDVVASDPDWPAMTMLPHPSSAEPTDRYLLLEFRETPDAAQLRDLRYVAARNGLAAYDPQQP